MPSSTCLKCMRIVPLGSTYCIQHKPKRRENKPRPHSRARGFTREYEKNRATTLKVSRVCVLCGQNGANTADHIKPRKYGIDNSLPNLAPAHKPCNSRRQDKPYTSEQQKRLAYYMYLLDEYLDAHKASII